MKKWLVIGVAFLVAGVGVVLAQSANDLYNQAVSAGGAYRSAYADYVQAKNQHLQYNTAATRVAAIAKTNQVLIARNWWLISYLRYLHQSLAEVTSGANPQSVTYLDLENQFNSLANLTLGQGDNFNQITAESATWEKGLEPVDKLIAVSRLQIASTRLANFQGQLAGYIQKYQQDHASLSAAQSTTLNLVNQKLNSSQAEQQQIDHQQSNYRTGYWTASTWAQTLNLSQSQLLEAARLLAELAAQP